MHKFIRLKNNLGCRVFSDNDDCTLHVYADDQDFDSESTYIHVVNYSDVRADYREDLCFYKKGE